MVQSPKTVLLILLVAALASACGGGTKKKSNGGDSGENSTPPISGAQPGTDDEGDGSDVVTEITPAPIPQSPPIPTPGPTPSPGPSPDPPPAPAPDKVKVYYTKGFLPLRFATDVSTEDGYQGWQQTLAPAAVTNQEVLTTTIIPFKVERN